MKAVVHQKYGVPGPDETPVKAHAAPVGAGEDRSLRMGSIPKRIFGSGRAHSIKR